MNGFGFIPLIAATAVLLTHPARADQPEAAAWSAIQKINEIAEEARVRCAAGLTDTCSTASGIRGTSFDLLENAKRCANGRYPRSCDRLRARVAEVDGLYSAYISEVGPARAAANRARLRCQTLPFYGTCESNNGVFQTHLPSAPNPSAGNAAD